LTPSRRKLLVATTASIAGLLAGACGPQATPTLFVAPTMAAASPAAPLVPADVPTAIPEATIVPTPLVPTPTPPCVDGLTYVQDLTIPDGSIVTPGQILDKRWQVSNSGTCNWDARYRLRLVGGDAMGASVSLLLFPARAGAEATIRIFFTAPQAAGTYECQWQAADPAGVPFGQVISMVIVVSP